MNSFWFGLVISLLSTLFGALLIRLEKHLRRSRRLYFRVVMLLYLVFVAVILTVLHSMRKGDPNQWLWLSIYATVLIGVGCGIAISLKDEEKRKVLAKWQSNPGRCPMCEHALKADNHEPECPNCRWEIPITSDGSS